MSVSNYPQGASNDPRAPFNATGRECDGCGCYPSETYRERVCEACHVLHENAWELLEAAQAIARSHPFDVFTDAELLASS